MNVSPPGDILEVADGDGPEIMGAAERHELAGLGAPLIVTAARTSVVTKHGESVGFTIKVAGQSKRRGEEWLLLLKSNDIRIRQAEAMIRALAMPDTDAIGPVYLAQITTKSGQAAWVLQNDPHIGATDTSNMSQRSEAVETGLVPAGVNGTDDDIPF